MDTASCLKVMHLGISKFSKIMKLTKDFSVGKDTEKREHVKRLYKRELFPSHYHAYKKLDYVALCS